MKKRQQRQAIKVQRRAIHPFSRMRAEKTVPRYLLQFTPLKRARKIGSYLDVDGEFPTAALNQWLLKHRKTLFFPTITDYKNCHMQFIQWQKNSTVKTNRYNIPEVVPVKPQIGLKQLDLVLVPLVGYDHCGNRLGMGGGFYDRYLASYPAHARPYILGVAFAAQKLATIQAESWDYPLDAILTQSGIQRFRR